MEEKFSEMLNGGIIFDIQKSKSKEQISVTAVFYINDSMRYALFSLKSNVADCIDDIYNQWRNFVFNYKMLKK
ncbi:MAG: hypothetical protein WC677_07615 [Clostridia bacterium]|jgi:hypothetical protein